MFLPKLGSKFSRTRIFCCENCIFTRILAYACVRESVRTWDIGLGM